MVDPQTLPHERLATARARAGYATASEAARAFGWNENTYRSHENGERGLRMDIAVKYAKAFKVTPEYILLGRDTEIHTPQGGDTLWGYIDDSGSLLEHSSDNYNGFKQLVASSLFMPRVGVGWAIEVRTQRPILGCNPSDLIVASIEKKFSPAQYQGALAIVDRKDGSMLLRRVRVGPMENILDTQLYPELSPLWEVVTGIFPVMAIIQKGYWHSEAREERDIRVQKSFPTRLHTSIKPSS